MDFAEMVGAAGVGILLIAFLLNLAGALGRRSRLYQGLNGLGAGIACYASWLIGFWPFVVLEGVWSLAALAALTRGVEAPRGSGAR